MNKIVQYKEQNLGFLALQGEVRDEADLAEAFPELAGEGAVEAASIDG